MQTLAGILLLAMLQLVRDVSELKQFRKTARNYLAIVTITATVLWLR
jgi:hypothetical protein